jgi:phosphoenolpyruvate carboxylase
VPVKFASWIGGDRDGNPNVTPAITHEVINHQRLRAAKLLLTDLNELYNELAICGRFSPNMITLADSIKDSPDRLELYRRVIGNLRQRLVRTIKECESIISTNTASRNYIMAETATYKRVSGWETVEPIYKANELMEPLMIMHDSLVQTGLELVADGLLANVIRRVSIFGMTLVPLDIREESTQHKLALDAITQYLGLGSYADWDESAKIKFLETELAGKRPLFRTRDLDNLGFDESVVKTLSTFRMLAGLEYESLGAYVISQAQTASDILAVQLIYVSNSAK